MASANDFIWVHDPKGGIVIGRKEFKMIETLLFETSLIRFIMPKPAHPEAPLPKQDLGWPFYIVNHINMRCDDDTLVECTEVPPTG